MTQLVAFVIGMMAWIVLWAVGLGPVVSFLVTLLIVVHALAISAYAPLLPRRSADGR